MYDLLAALLVAGCLYEAGAILTKRFPTISALVWRLPLRLRLAVWFVVSVVLADHFVWRRYL